MEFENGLHQSDGSRDWVSTPANDNDTHGMYEYLIWAAKKSGWSSDKLHYIEMFYKKTKHENVSSL